MQLATSTNILCERADGSRIPMAQSIRACAAAGYKALDFGFVELSLQDTPFTQEGDAWKAEIAAFGELAKSLGMHFIQAHATIYDFCNPRPDDAKSRQLFLRSIEGAHILGAPWIVAHPSTGVKDGAMSPETHALNVHFFREMAAYAASFGLGIAIENMWGQTREGIKRYAIEAAELLRLIEDIGCENVGACWDVEHASVESLPQGESIRMLGRHLKATHISDETGHNNIHILPYTGFVGWDEVLDALVEIRYNGPFAFEIQHYLPHMPMELVPTAMAFSVQVGQYMIERHP